MSILNNAAITRHIDVQERLTTLRASMEALLEKHVDDVNARLLLADLATFEKELAFNWDARAEELINANSDLVLRYRAAEKVAAALVERVQGIDKVTYNLLYKDIVKAWHHYKRSFPNNDPARDRRYTVMLVWHVGTDDDETFFFRVEAGSVDEAINKAYDLAKRDLTDHPVEDFETFLVCEGWIDNLMNVK